jgi:SAM-dependent methyltransferase
MGSPNAEGVFSDAEGMKLSSFLVERAKVVARRFTRRERGRTRLAGQYVRGEGIEIGALHRPLRVPARVRYVDRYSRDGLREAYPELAALPVVDPAIVDDAEQLTKVEAHSQDFVIANHFIEHCADPIGTLMVFASKLRPGGVIYLAMPDKRYCFDHGRASATLEHLLADHVDGGAASRVGHFEDFARYSCLRGKGPEEEVRRITAECLAINYSIHFHAWTFDEFRQFLLDTIAMCLPEFELADAKLNIDEGLFVLRRVS